MIPLADLDRNGHLPRIAYANYVELVALGETHERACLRTGLNPATVLATLAQQRRRRAM